MAVTADKYSTDTFNDKDNGQNKQIYTYIPLALTAYVSDSNFKEKFFCHEVWKKKDSQGKDCIIGLINPSAGVSEGYYNQLHADSRKGKLRYIKGGVEYIVLNDGGLNTKPFIGFTNTAGILCTKDCVILYITYKNAYYINTTNARIDIKAKRSGSQIFSYGINLDIPTAMQSQSASYALFINPDWNQVVQTGDAVEMTLSITNEEGTYTTDTLTGLSIISDRFKIIELYKIDQLQNPLNCDPMADGIPYRGLLRKSWYDVVSHDSPAHPNLHDMFDTTQYGPNVSCPTTVEMTGIQAQVASGDIVSDYLPDGIYYGLPVAWEDPEVSQTAALVAMYISNSQSMRGEVVKYNYVTIPQPVVQPAISRFLVTVGDDEMFTSYAYIDLDNFCHVAVYPKFIIDGRGVFSVNNVEVTLCIHNSNVLETKTFSATLDLASGMTNFSPRCSNPSEPAGINEIPYIEFTPFYWNEAQYASNLDVIIEVQAANIQNSGGTQIVISGTSSLTDTVVVDNIMQTQH